MTSSRCTGAVALLLLAVFSFETGHTAAASRFQSAAVQATQRSQRKLRAEERKRRDQEEEDQVENNADGYNGYDGYEGYNANNAYNGSDTLIFRGTGFGKKWNEFFGSMKTWGSNLSNNHNSSLSDECTSTQDSSDRDSSSDYGGSYQGSGFGHYTNDSWNSGNPLSRRIRRHEL
jgi:hypothetical protein